MFARVRASLLIWNLLIICVILLIAGTVTYFSQRQSLLDDVDRLLTQAASAPPGIYIADGNPRPSVAQRGPFTFVVDSSGHVLLESGAVRAEVRVFSLVVDSSGHVLADPQNLGVKDVALPKASSVTIGGRVNVLWDQGIRIQAVQREQNLVYFLKTPTGEIQGQSVRLLVQPDQSAAYIQTIATGMVQGQPVRLLVRPVTYVSKEAVVDGAPTSVVDATTTVAAAAAQKDSPNAFLVTGVSLVPMEQSLHQTLVFLLVGGGAGLLLSLLGSWFLAGRSLVPIETAYRRQQEFVADAAHELRTPLTVLQTSTHLLNQHRGEPIEAQGRVFDDLHEEIGRLTRLTCDLLDLARSDLGQLELAVGSVDLDALGQAMIRRLSAVTDERQIELRYECSDRPPVVDADSDRLQQVLLILLDNALKHTPPGGKVTLAVSDTGRNAVAEVRDTGEGIPAEILNRVFDRFYRGDTARSRATGSAGLGLAIAKTLVEAHGGTLTLSSAPGSGTTATIRLPSGVASPANGRWSRMGRRFPQLSRLF